MHIHLDLVGGLSGDMFIGALLDCYPDLAESLSDQLVLAGFRELVKLSIEPVNDGTLTGTRFKVTEDHDAHGHHHRHYSEIRTILSDSRLDGDTKARAQDIFRLIAEVEARIHGKAVEDVAFHEVGAWDSIADIVCAAHLISASGAASWSVSKLPMGRGQVKTAHGMLPVPAPATALLLEGFECFDDGIEGERITPTGAAILKHLAPTQSGSSPGSLARSGFGFGTKRFPGISNVVRAMVFDAAAQPWQTDQVLQLEFEIDDQTPEELSDALDRIRAVSGTIDVVQSTVFGKKGRQVMSVRVLASSESEAQVITACFDQTTTLGIRRRLVERAILVRQERTITRNDESFRVKIAQRPGGTTAKADIDDIVSGDSLLEERRRTRDQVENTALRPDEKD